MVSFLEKIFGDPNKKVLEKIQPVIEEINGLENEMQELKETDLKSKTLELKEKLKNGQSLDDILPQAFALVRETAKRTLGQRHYDVQLLGGIVLHRGQIAEMITGEGKTLTATCPLYLNALTDKGAHVVTVNDYLARRDTAWMGQVFHALGLSVACIQHDAAFLYDPDYKAEQATQEDEARDKLGGFKVFEDYLRPVARREAYDADITYGTNNEFGFDYLRDNMAQKFENMVQRPLHYAIVDEVDSILIDEARTPLIISAPAEESTDLYYKFSGLVKNLNENEHYNVDEKMRAATLTEEGVKKMENLLGLENIYTEGGINMVHHIEQALRAHALFKRDRDYVVKDDEVIIVDEFTGRLMFGRRYSEGLHQAIEAKEGAEIQRESLTMATVTFQNLFRLYEKIAGMTGTAATEAEEFSKIYKLEVVQVPTNKPMIRQDKSDRIYKNESAKFKAIAQEIKERNKKGQPVLVGTISIEKNEVLGDMLAREGVKCELLNAKNHEREAEIVAQAGRPGAVTVATNMAGRGVDIILGGNPHNAERAEQVKQAGGLLVLGTERHESRRIDNQLRGRCGRQGDPGESRFYVSMEDDLMRIFAGDRMKSLMETLRVPEDMPIENKMVSRSIESAQNKVESHNFDIRKHLLEYDDVLNKHREVIYRKRREILKLDFDLRAANVKEPTLKDKIFEYIEKEIEQVVLFHTQEDSVKHWDLKEIYEVMNTIFPVALELRKKLEDFGEEARAKADLVKIRTEIIKHLVDLADSEFDKIEEKVEDTNMMQEIKKGIMLRAIDNLWIEHLEAIDHLRAGIGLRGYGQRDPLVEYKRETYKMFNELLTLIQKQIVYSVFKVAASIKLAPSIMQKAGVRFHGAQKTMGKFTATSTAPRGAGQSQKKVGRNDPCPCGATHADGRPKKYKHCCGQ
ncbi:preprotein translocase subunit SecA [Patescibacteria group bacterium]|nr:preprotein translocase subunit SecA [Patescibacteria group bacterium]MBU1922216.1 preprotein translocase subunit SecA [Patescibacteria group bacterium]